jgi:hypothetical protein
VNSDELQDDAEQLQEAYEEARKKIDELTQAVLRLNSSSKID